MLAKGDVGKAVKRLKDLAAFIKANPLPFRSPEPAAAEVVGQAEVGLHCFLPDRNERGELVLLLRASALGQWNRRYSHTDGLRFTFFLAKRLVQASGAKGRATTRFEIGSWVQGSGDRSRGSSGRTSLLLTPVALSLGTSGCQDQLTQANGVVVLMDLRSYPLTSTLLRRNLAWLKVASRDCLQGREGARDCGPLPSLARAVYLCTLTSCLSDAT